MRTRSLSRSSWKEAALLMFVIGVIILCLFLYVKVKTSEPTGVYVFPPDKYGCVKIEERRELWFIYDIREKVECP